MEPYIQPIKGPGAERIRSITDSDKKHRTFDSYPWHNDRAFNAGLLAILGDPSSMNMQGASADEIALHGRIFYYQGRTGVKIDYAEYKEFLARHPDHRPPPLSPNRGPQQPLGGASSGMTSSSLNLQRENQASTATAVPFRPGEIAAVTSKLKDLSTALDAPLTQNPELKKSRIKATDRDAGDGAQDEGEDAEGAPAWQKAAPKADLFVDRSKLAQADAAASGSAEPEPNYPLGFAQMLEMLQKGEPIPGIREIPDTVVRDPAVKPFGAMATPRKPWEKDIAASASSQPSSALSVDQDFPPLNDGGGSDSSEV